MQRHGTALRSMIHTKWRSAPVSWLGVLPLRVRQITRIELVAHDCSLPNPTRFLNRLLGRGHRGIRIVMDGKIDAG